MIAVPLPALREQPLTLELDDPSRGVRPDGGPLLADRIALGGPYAVPVTAEYVADDPDLKAFVEQEAAHSVYHLVHLSVSFATEPASPRLDRASIELTLSATAGATRPVAWSMTPMRVLDPVQVERRFRLGPQLKLQEMEVSLGAIEQTTSRKRAETFLQAQRELRSDPAWEFCRTAGMKLSGSYRLIMVVRAANDAGVSISGAVRASVKGNLLHWYRRELPGPLSLAAAL
ncbi:MAG TPA: hypothetical protein VMA73_12975 [Streptosporangiaceae bacterium]|nr:hypothetical protein [Streptosporangiaceae bacterium]